MNALEEPFGIPQKKQSRDVAARWTAKLADVGWTPVADVFLDYYCDLKITSGEAMFIVHLIRYKWDSRMPFPGFPTIARKMNVTDISVRKYARDLEKRHLLRRISRPGQTTVFDLSPLFAALEREMNRPERAEKSITRRSSV